MSLVIAALGIMQFFGMERTPRASGEPVAKVERVELPSSGDGAPEAVEEPEPPRMVAVPDIPYNATREEAEKMLEEHGLKLGEVKKKPNDEYEEGGVFYQDPLPGVEVEEGSRVGITLSTGPEEKKDKGAGDKKDDGKDKEGSKSGKDLMEDPPDPPTNDLYLTVPKMGIYGDYVANDASEATLYNGAGKITETGFPWQPNANTYIASHVLGYAGTGSYMHFAALPSMTYGDEIILTDANGTEYVYEVVEILTVPLSDTSVTYPIPGRDLVSLQTCINPPAYDLRLVVRGERVDVRPAQD
ncbi:MAG: sortase [Actinomycetota bacterium]